MPRPKKIQWPIGFEEMLRYAYATKRPEDRLKFYRLFLRDYLHSRSTIQASPAEIEKALLEDRQKQFQENWAYHIRMWSHGSFDKWKRENIRSRMSKMAAASWTDEARKNRKKS